MIIARTRIGGENVSPAGRPKSNNSKIERLEIRLTTDENEKLKELAAKIGTNRTDILMRGAQLVELQRENREFEDLSNCLIIRELQRKGPLDDEDKRQILNYLEFLKKKYV